MKISTIMLLSAFCLSPAHAYMLPQHPTKAYVCDECDKLTHQNLKTSWRITEMPADQKVSNEQKSYSYNQRVTAKQLREGITLSTRAPGAVVRITPLQKKALPELEFKAPENEFIAIKEASALHRQNESLEESLLSSQHQSMMQIKPHLGFGNFIIKSKKNAGAVADSYLINVFDKFSLIYLKVEPHALHYQYGDQFAATITLQDHDNKYSVTDINARLIGSDDKVYPLKLVEVKRNQFQTSAPLLSELNTHGDNWYIEVEVVNEQKDGITRRTGRAAFSYSLPSASLVSIKKISSHPLVFAATIDVATGSRYALQSVLLSKNPAGETRPVETSQNAHWLAPGKQIIKFGFDNSSQLTDDTLSLGYLRLTDYGQLKTVYQYDHPIKLSQLMD